MAYKQSIGSKQKNTDSTFKISEGDPVEKNKGVKKYQAIDMADYNKRQQMYSDSLSANTATQNIVDTIKNQSGGGLGVEIRGINFNQEKSYAVGKKEGQSLSHMTGYKAYGDSNVDRALQSDNAADAVSALFGFSSEKPKPKSNNTGFYENYSGVKGVESSINTLKKTDKSLGMSNKQSKYYKKRKVGETLIEHHRDTSVSGFLTGDHDDSVTTFNLPYRPKPKQEILPPLSKNKPTVTKSVVKKKPRPKDTISKMPIGKLKSKSTAPKKLSNRKPENFVYYDKPKKTSLAITGSPGSKARYATVNRGDKKGNKNLTKKEYDQEMKNKFIKIK